MFGINGHGKRLRGRERWKCETSIPELAQIECFFLCNWPNQFPELGLGNQVSRPTSSDKQLKSVILYMPLGSFVRGHFASTV